MIYGDNPQKINLREDKLGLKYYSYAPQIAAIAQSGNLYIYCGSNPIYLADTQGDAWETIFDIISLCFSVAEVVSNPSDGWAWAGLAGDVLDLIPFIAGIGEIIKGGRVTLEIADTAHDAQKTAKLVDQAFEVADSRVLRNNLISAGVKAPNYKNTVHHIVAGKSQYAEESRKILAKYGIGINDAANGVFLPTVKGVSDAAYHPGLHTKAYYERVNELLRSANSKEEVLQVLAEISRQLASGTFLN